MKLSLGCRDRGLEGFVNMDIDPHPGVDIVGDVADLSRFKDGEVEAIHASHILEHFPHTQTDSVLREWHRVLEPQGILYVAVPDFRRAVELYLKTGMAEWVVKYLWGDQGYKTAYHYTGFDYDRLHGILSGVGFSDISRVEVLPVHRSGDCSTQVSSLDGKPVSLNVVAIK